MEKIFYVLIPIAYFLYNAYSNFVKEQEKSKRRNLAEVELPSQDFKQEKVIENKSAKGHFDSADFLEDKKIELQNRKKQIKSNSPVAVRDYYNPEEVSEEVANSRKIHQPHHHQFEFPEKSKQEEYFDFDLRKAIIQQTILNRPNY